MANSSFLCMLSHTAISWWDERGPVPEHSTKGEICRLRDWSEDEAVRSKRFQLKGLDLNTFEGSARRIQYEEQKKFARVEDVS
jgi:hypothetical protein